MYLACSARVGLFGHLRLARHIASTNLWPTRGKWRRTRNCLPTVAFTDTGNAQRNRGENMLPGPFRCSRPSEQQAYRRTERFMEVQPVEGNARAVAIAARLRAMIRCSTDPAWLEKMAREVEARARQR
jgi:hypothetical protein